jgi:hypothetical protein
MQKNNLYFKEVGFSIRLVPGPEAEEFFLKSMHVNGVFAIVNFRNVCDTKVQNYTETIFSNFLKLKSTAVEET